MPGTRARAYADRVKRTGGVFGAIALLAVAACTQSNPHLDLARQRLAEAAQSMADTPPPPNVRILTLTSPAAEVRVQTAPFRISAFRRSSNVALLGGTSPGSLWYERDGKRHTLTRAVGWEKDPLELRLQVQTEEPGIAKVNLRLLADRTLQVTLEPPIAENPPVALGASWPSTSDEAFYGLTERLRDSPSVGWGEMGLPYDELFPPEVGSLDRRGETIEMFVRPTVSAYAPFYHSSQGYGLAVDGATPGVFDLASSHPTVASFRFEAGTTEESQRLRFFLFIGPEHAEILDEYTRLTGRPIEPPDWAFLPWRWRGELESGAPALLDGTEMNAQLVEDVTMLEKYGIPAGVYLLDRPVLEGEYGFARFAWDEERLPNFRASLAALRDRGYRVVLWSSTWMCGDAPHDNGTIASSKGFLAPGHATAQCSDSGGTVLDVTNPDARSWWRDRLAAFLDAEDIDGIKLDRGEEYIPSTEADVWADGRNGREVHNDYVRLQTKLHRDALDASRPDGDFVLISRAGYTGTQTDSLLWSGDLSGSEAAGMWSGTDLGLRAAIIAQLRSAFLGFPVWGSDTGGYYEFKDREVFARWIEFSAFSGLMEIGGVGAHAPWDMPTSPRVDDEMIEIYRRYSEIRVALVPYLANAAAEASRTGMPLARPMVFYDRADPELRDVWDQYLLGPDLLVAPVWRVGQREREVYLPRGGWRDWWDPEAPTIAGPKRVTVDVPLDRIPVFVRDGAPLASPPA